MSNQIDDVDHCFQHQCQTTPNISNGGGLKQIKLVESLAISWGKRYNRQKKP